MLKERRIQKLKKYCREPLENIKGYKEAVESEGRYDCHHINELTFTRDELKKMNMYYNRPASELVFMKAEEHRKWHNKWNGHPSWKGDTVTIQGYYRRAKNLYKSGKISEADFQPYRDAWSEYWRARRNKK